MPSDNEFAPPAPVDTGSARDTRPLPVVLAVGGFVSAFVLLFLADYENWSSSLRLPLYALLGVSSVAWRMRGGGRRLPLPANGSRAAEAQGDQKSFVAMHAPAGTQLSAASYPEIGTYQGESAFVVPTLAKVQRRGLIAAVGFSAFSLAFTVVAPFPTNLIMALIGLFFGYLGVLNAHGLKAGSAYYLTAEGLTAKDAAGTLFIAWSEVTGLTVTAIGKTPMLKLESQPGSVVAGGSARRWLPLNRRLGAEFPLRPATHTGGIDGLQPLLLWCLAEPNRQLIGTQQGRAAFWQVPSPSSAW